MVTRSNLSLSLIASSSSLWHAQIILEDSLQWIGVQAISVKHAAPVMKLQLCVLPCMHMSVVIAAVVWSGTLHVQEGGLQME